MCPSASPEASPEPSAERAAPGWVRRTSQTGTGKGRVVEVARLPTSTGLSTEGTSQVNQGRDTSRSQGVCGGRGSRGRTANRPDPSSFMPEPGQPLPWSSRLPQGGLCGRGGDRSPRDHTAGTAVLLRGPAPTATGSTAPQAQGLGAWALPPSCPHPPTPAAVDCEGELRPGPWNP